VAVKQTCPDRRNRTISPIVVVTWPDYDVESQRLGAALRRAGLHIRLEPKRTYRPPSELKALVADAAAAIVSTDPFDADVLRSSPELRVIARVGVGVDSIDLGVATACGVAVTVTPGANESTVADHTIALMLAALRRVCEQDAAIRRGEWNRTGVHAPWTLSGSTIGLIGYGRIGRLVRKRLKGFSVEVLVSDPAHQGDDAVPSLGLHELLAASDIVSLHVPLLAGTRHMLGPAELALMRPHSVLVNTARGGIVDEEALADALEEGRLRAAALDVFEREPPHCSRLLKLPNVVLSPHYAGLSEQSIEEMTRRATASVIDVLHDRVPEHLANPDVLTHPSFAQRRSNHGTHDR
jgi:phosphoglycerate dehydrogenase-like enzyme